VKRLDRLISDISDASRLDAELQRRKTDAVGRAPSCSPTVVTIANEVRNGGWGGDGQPQIRGQPGAHWWTPGK